MILTSYTVPGCYLTSLYLIKIYDTIMWPALKSVNANKSHPSLKERKRGSKQPVTGHLGGAQDCVATKYKHFYCWINIISKLWPYGQGMVIPWLVCVCVCYVCHVFDLVMQWLCLPLGLQLVFKVDNNTNARLCPMWSIRHVRLDRMRRARTAI